VNATDPGGSGLYTRKWYTFSTYSDTTPPTTTITLAGTLGENLWYISPITITLTATDDLSGVDYTMYDLDSTGWTLYTNPFTVSEDMIHTIQYYSVDTIGNTETVKTANVKIDQEPPLTTHSFSGEIGNNGWYCNGIFNLHAIDNTSGVNHTFVNIDSGSWSEYTSPIFFDSDGTHTIKYYSVDNAGNEESVKGPFTIKIDNTPPQIELVKFQIDLFTIKFIAEASDSPSGVDYVQFSIDGVMQFNDTTAPFEWTWSGYETFTLTVVVYDKAGNSQSDSMSTPYVISTQNLIAPYQFQRLAKDYLLND
jgi:hypothetical protein